MLENTTRYIQKLSPKYPQIFPYGVYITVSNQIQRRAQTELQKFKNRTEELLRNA